jgi:hypothetical protein
MALQNALNLCLTPPGLWITLTSIFLISTLLYLRRKRVIQWLRRWNFIEFTLGPFTFGKSPVSSNEHDSKSEDREKEPEFLEGRVLVRGKLGQEEDYNRLLELLRNRFQEQDLRAAAFYILGPGSYDNLRGSTRDDKAMSLVETLISRGKVMCFYEYVDGYRPDINLQD